MEGKKRLTKEEREKYFPYELFPIRFVYPIDTKDQVVAHFQCQEHVDKYVARHNMKESDYLIWYKDESLRPAPKPKRTRKSRPKPTAAEASIAEPAKTVKKRGNGRKTQKDDEKSTQSSKTNKTDVESKSSKKRTRSSSTVRSRRTSMDSTRNTTRNRKKV